MTAPTGQRPAPSAPASSAPPSRAAASSAGAARAPASRARALSALEERAVALVDEADLTALTTRLVRCPGENPPGQEAETVRELVDICTRLGLHPHTSQVAAGRANVHARTASGTGPGLLLLGHTDVVPVGDGWTAEPFGGMVRDGRVYGRGATDMKGGLAACVVAMAAVQRAAADTGQVLTGPVELIATVDEEEGGIGIRYLMHGAPARYLGCVTAEPTDLQTIVAARGDCYVDIEVTGLAAHAGRPGDGRNAVYGAVRIVESLRRWHDELAAHAHPLAGPAGWSVGQIHGGQGTAIVPARCVVQADRRLLPGEDPAAVLAAVRERVAGLGLDADGLTTAVTMPMHMPGFDTDRADPFAVAVDAALGDAGGPGLPMGGWTASCEGGYIARDLGVPTVVLGPGSVNDQAHRPDEFVRVADLVVSAHAYARLAVRMLAPQTPDAVSAARRP